jgi:hypothetical protein
MKNQPAKIRPSANLFARLQPDRVTTTPQATIIQDRLTIVNRLREMATDTWSGTAYNPVSDMILAFATRLEREIKEAG